MMPEVERGARLLDEKNPGWYKRIQLSRLDMGNGRYCILGQLYYTYLDGQWKLGLSDWKGCAKHGFVIDFDLLPTTPKNDLLDYEAWEKRYQASEKMWTDLQDAWVSLIRARLAVDEVEQKSQQLKGEEEYATV